jgi:CheY-like chemotaxis protein
MKVTIYPASNTALLKHAQPLSQLADWPPDAALLYCFEPERASEDMKQLSQARIAGQRGPLAIYTEDLPLLEETVPWLRQNLQDIAVISASEPATLLAWQKKAKLLTRAQWQAAAAAHILVQTAKLKHDINHSLNAWPQSQTDLRNQLEVLWASLGPMADLLKPQIQALQSLAQAQQPQSSNTALKQAWLQFWQALNPAPVRQKPDSPMLGPLLEGLQTLQKHWRAFLADGALFLTQLEKVQIAHAETQLHQDVLSWLKSYSPAQLNQGRFICQAAEALKTLMTQRSSATRGGDLAQLIHNTLDQHLYATAHLIAHWEPILAQQLSQSKPLIYSELEAQISSLQARVQQSKLSPLLLETLLPAPAHAAEVSSLHFAEQDLIAGHSDRIILIIEDNPVWLDQIADTLKALLEQFLSHYPTQQFRRWKMVKATNWAQAQAWIEKADLLISDLSVPLATNQPAQRENGVAWLSQHALGFNQRPIPILIHTTPTWFLSDHLNLTALGIHDLDYVFKSQPQALSERLWLALERLRKKFSQQATHLLEIEFHTPPPALILDQVPLDLTPQQRKLLLILAQERVLSTGQIFAEIFPDAQASLPKSDLEPSFNQLLKFFPQVDHMAYRSHWRVLQQIWQNLRARPMYARYSDGAFWPIFEAAIKCSHAPAHIWIAGQEQSPLFKLLQRAEPKRPMLFPAGLVAFLNVKHQQAEPSAPELNAKLSKMIYPLKEATAASFQKAHRSLDLDSVFVSIAADDSEHASYLKSPQQANQHLYGLHKCVQVKFESEQPNPPEAPLNILIIENDPLYAEELQNRAKQVCLHRGLSFHIQVAKYVEEVKACLAKALPDLVLLDLHLPLTQAEYLANPQSGQNNSCYLALKHLREVLQKQAPQKPYRVLVTSSLSDDDDLRRQGLALEIPVRNFIPKGQALAGLNWPDSLVLKLHRVLLELEHNRYIADQSKLLENSAWPIEVRILSATEKSLKLAVTAQTPQGPETTQALHKGKNLAVLRLLLKHWPHKLAQAELAAVLADAPPFHKLENARNRLRKDEINPKWPVAWIGRSNPAKEILKQAQIEGVTWYWLNISAVNDPEGVLNS